MSKLPVSLMNSLTDAKGFDKEAFVRVHDSEEQITSIRFNPAKSTVKGEKSIVPVVLTPDSCRAFGKPTAAEGLPTPDSRVPWSSHGYYLTERPSFTFDPLFHAGCYYVQEASSMFLEDAMKQVVDLSAPLKVLDLCAAPGGKSTLIQSIISSDSLLVSNDVIKSRASILEENMIKWGGANVIVTNNDPKDFSRLESFFDVMVIDAPCSGSGLFRRDEGAIDEWSDQNVSLCSQRQQRILADVLPALKEDGIIIYSTCSYSKAEDEEILDWFCTEFSMDSLRLNVLPEWNIVETVSENKSAYGYRFWPDKLRGEGFFIACLQKKEGAEFSYKSSKKSILEKLTKAEEAIVRPWLNETYQLKLLKQGDSIFAIPFSLDLPIEAIMVAKLYVRQVGVRVGKIMGKDLVPDHALALSTIINPALVAVSLNHDQAIQYLRREEVKNLNVASEDSSVAGEDTSHGMKPGWTLVEYEGMKIGWIKVLQNRINNYYPKELRILKK